MLARPQIYKQTAHWKYSDPGIPEIEDAKKSLSATGFHIKLGTDIAISDHISLLLDGKYVFAKTKLPVSINAASSGTATIGGIAFDDNRSFKGEEQSFDIDLGGFLGTVGLRIMF